MDGLVINPGAYTHTSIAIPDAIRAVGISAVEVHLSDISQREPFRRLSYTGPACVATIMGKQVKGYLEAVDLLYRRLSGE
jgi:3-dehydroquinate dehydratase-2